MKAVGKRFEIIRFSEKGSKKKPVNALVYRLYGGELGIRTLETFRSTAFRVLFALGISVSAVVGDGSFGNGESPCAATDFGRADRY